MKRKTFSIKGKRNKVGKGFEGERPTRGRESRQSRTPTDKGNMHHHPWPEKKGQIRLMSQSRGTMAYKNDGHMPPKKSLDDKVQVCFSCKGSTKGEWPGKRVGAGKGREMTKRKLLPKTLRARAKMSLLRFHAGKKYHNKSCFHDLVKEKIKGVGGGICKTKKWKNKKSGKGAGGKGLQA